MKAKIVYLAVALALVFSLAAAIVPAAVNAQEPIQVPVTIDPTQAAGQLDERYIGFSIDTAQLTGVDFWGSPEPPDLESPKLRKLVSYLAPSRFRIGGTDADGAYFCPEEGDCVPPPSYQNGLPDPANDTAWFFTHEDIRQIADFAEAVGSKVLFCVNMGPGPRDPETGTWTPDNARELLRYVQSLPNGHLFDIWEAGNEVNIIFHHYNMPKPLTPQLYASDLSTLRALIDEEDPGDLLAAPGCFFVPFPALRDLNFTTSLLELELARDNIDIVTWHLYATQSERCDPGVSPYPANKDNLFNETAIAMNREFARYVQTAAEDLPVMNSESASAQCGGQAGVSDTLLDALWFADWIGIMAQEGSRSIVRQTIVGRDYGLLDPTTYDPRPSFLAYVMFRRTVEGYRLKTTADRALVKAHGFTTAEMDGSVTAVLSNPSENALTVEITLAGTTVLNARQWTIGANGDLTAKRATIEGQMAQEDGTIPNPPGTPVYVEQGKAYAQVEPNSLVFVVLEPRDKCALVTTATGTGTASLSSDSGALESLAALAEGTLPAAGKPNLVFPHGFFSFTITGLTPGQTVTVTITLPSAVPVGTQYWKYHASEGGWIQIPMGSDDGDNVITITLVDGGLGDDDGVADGTIVDQGGPGNPPPAPAAGVPLFPTVLGGIAAVVAAGFVAFALRRRIFS